MDNWYVFLRLHSLLNMWCQYGFHINPMSIVLDLCLPFNLSHDLYRLQTALGKGLPEAVYALLTWIFHLRLLLALEK